MGEQMVIYLTTNKCRIFFCFNQKYWGLGMLLSSLANSNGVFIQNQHYYHNDNFHFKSIEWFLNNWNIGLKCVQRIQQTKNSLFTDRNRIARNLDKTNRHKNKTETSKKKKR